MTKQKEHVDNPRSLSADNQAESGGLPPQTDKRNRPLIIELVGPPGSGKTTITEILKKKNEKIRVEIFPFINNRKDFPFFALNLLRLFPDFIRILLKSKGKHLPTKRDIAIMTILTGWDLILRNMTSSNEQMIILEEGAICLLAKLRGFGADSLQESAATDWWQKTYRKWAHTLDMVIVLDTPVNVLLKRIRSRELQYEIRDMPDEKAVEYLTQIHEAEIHAMSYLKGPVVFQLSTPEKSAAEIAVEINNILCPGSFDNSNDNRHSS